MYKLLMGILLTAFVLLPDMALADQVSVSKAWTRASVPGQTVAGIYFDIESTVDAKLVAVETPVSTVAELHLMTMQEGVMRMRAVASIDLPAYKTVRLEPGGYHVMVFDLNRPLVAGEQFPITLLLSNESGGQSQVKVVVDVRKLDGSKAHHH